MAIHTTEQEIKFINGLGQYSPQTPPGSEARAELLRGYIKAADKRSDWGDIDKGQAVRAAKEELRKSA